MSLSALDPLGTGTLSPAPIATTTCRSLLRRLISIEPTAKQCETRLVQCSEEVWSKSDIRFAK